MEVALTRLDGRHLAHEHGFNLIILNVMLPGLNGWQWLPLVHRMSSLPVRFLTARDPVEDRVRGLELGADDYLIKPFFYAELRAWVHSLLRRGPPRAVELFPSPICSETC